MFNSLHAQLPTDQNNQNQSLNEEREEDLFMLLKITQIENEQEPDVKYFFDAWESANDPEEPLLLQQYLDD